jgi:hypothetical protein
MVAALGWDLDELRYAVRRWVPNLRNQGQLTEGQGAALLAVSFGVGVERTFPVHMVTGCRASAKKPQRVIILCCVK